MYVGIGICSLYKLTTEPAFTQILKQSGCSWKHFMPDILGTLASYPIIIF